ncbi:MAG: hypothetical protein HZB38_01315 [Planctomycetes bacterium]|nr:hypothetical protein [Planctomycetota bacterium]
MPSTRSARKKTNRVRKPAKPAPRALAPARVATAIEAFQATTGTRRFAAGKALALTAERYPERVYPHFDAVAARLGGQCKICRWNALRILAALAGADRDHKLDSILDAYLAYITCGNLITAANAVHGVGKIAAARPEWLARIVDSMLAVEACEYETPECRNVLIGHVLDGLASLGPTALSKPKVLAFIRRQLANPRAAVARRATELTGRC